MSRFLDSGEGCKGSKCTDQLVAMLFYDVKISNVLILPPPKLYAVFVSPALTADPSLLANQGFISWDK